MIGRWSQRKKTEFARRVRLELPDYRSRSILRDTNGDIVTAGNRGARGKWNALVPFTRVSTGSYHLTGLVWAPYDLHGRFINPYQTDPFVGRCSTLISTRDINCAVGERDDSSTSKLESWSGREVSGPEEVPTRKSIPGTWVK